MSLLGKSSKQGEPVLCSISVVGVFCCAAVDFAAAFVLTGDFCGWFSLLPFPIGVSFCTSGTPNRLAIVGIPGGFFLTGVLLLSRATRGIPVVAEIVAVLVLRGSASLRPTARAFTIPAEGLGLCAREDGLLFGACVGGFRGGFRVFWGVAAREAGGLRG